MWPPCFVRLLARCCDVVCRRSRQCLWALVPECLHSSLQSTYRMCKAWSRWRTGRLYSGEPDVMFVPDLVRLTTPAVCCRSLGVDIYSGAVVLETVYISSCLPDIWSSVASFTVISDGLRARAVKLSVSLLNSFCSSLFILLILPYLKGYQEEHTARCCACFKSTFKSVISLHWKWNKNVPTKMRERFLKCYEM